MASRAPYLPQVAASAQYQRTTGNIPVRPGYNSSNAAQSAANTTANTQSATWDPTFNAYTFGASASQLIYDFGQTSERWRSSEANVASAVDSERANQIQIVSNVRKAYFQARAQKDLVAVANDAVKNQQRHLDQIDGLVAQGMRPEIDRVTAQTNVANAQVIKLRLDIKETSGVTGSDDLKFQLQFAQSSDFTASPGFVAEAGNCNATSSWCYATSTGGNDNQIISTKIFSTSDACSAGVGKGCGTHNTSGVSTSKLSGSPGRAWKCVRSATRVWSSASSMVMPNPGLARPKTYSQWLCF